jgi:hypothetical protein
MQSAYEDILARLDLETAPPPGEWTPRQVLAHVIGALHRLPLQAGYYRAGAQVLPLVVDEVYWLPEWDNAPLPVFEEALLAAIAGVRALLHRLHTADLSHSITHEVFETATLAEFLFIAIEHVDDLHVPQLRAFVAA